MAKLKQDTPRLTYEDMIKSLGRDLQPSLGVIKACADFLALQTEPSYRLTPEQRDFVDRMTANANKAIKIAQLICDYEPSKLNIIPEERTTRLKDFIQEEFPMWEAMAQKREIALAYQSQEIVTVAMPAKDLRAIFEYIMLFGLSHALPKSTLKIEVRSVAHHMFDRALISIQVDLTRKITKGQITLALAEQMASIYGASLAIKESDGELPHVTMTVDVPAVSDKHIAPKKPLILVAEDDKEIGQFICEALSDEGFEVSYAENGQKALMQIRQIAPQLIISDIKMPQLDGIELLCTLRTQGDFTPFVWVSGFYEKISADMAASVFKADAFLLKPFTVDLLLATARGFFSSRQLAEIMI